MTTIIYDPEETKRQIVELEKLREAHRQRLAILQMRAAQLGIDGPVHVETEIDDIDQQIAQINAKIAQLQAADQHSREIVPVDPASLLPVTVVPATINERILTLTLAMENLRDEMRRNFTALQVAQHKDTESLWNAITDTRDLVSGERDERLDWQDGEQRARRYRHKTVVRWLWVMSAAVVLLFVILAIFVIVEYVRDVLLVQAARGGR